jgi:hypothetical protein
MNNIPFDLVELTALTEELYSAHEQLTDSQKNMSDVVAVMQNVRDSLDHIKKFGQIGVEQLNLDKSLESLCHIETSLLTVEKAQEGLGEVARAALEKLKEWCTKIKNWIIAVVKKIMDFFTGTEAKNKQFLALVAQTSPETFVKIMKNAKVDKNSSAGNETFMAEAFLTKNIISYDTVTKLFDVIKKAVVDEDAYLSDMDAANKLISELDNSQNAQVELDKMHQLKAKFEAKIQSNEEAIKKYTNDTITLLKNGSGSGDDFDAIGWNKSTASEFITKYNEVEADTKKKLNEFLSLRRYYDDALASLEKEFGNPDDAYSQDKIELVRAVINSNASDVRWMTKLASDSALVLEKCRSALWRELHKGSAGKLQ